MNDLQSSVPGAASENGGAGEANAASGNSAAGEADAGGEIGAADGSHATPENLGQRVSDLDLSQPVRATIVQINEILQLDSEQYTSISRLGFHLGLTVTIDEDERGMIRLASDDGHEIELSHDLAHAIRVSS
nr:FeoA domain-containing protein [Corynebacterium aquatimens]